MMIRVKKEIKEIFKRDFVYYLFDGCKVITNLHIYVFPFFTFLFTIVLWVIFRNTSTFYVLTLIGYLMWLFYNYVIRNEALKGKNISEKELKKQIVLNNYNDAVGDVFDGSKIDIRLIETILPEFRSDAQKYSSRFIFKLVLLIIILTAIFCTYFSVDFAAKISELQYFIDKLLLLPIVYISAVCIGLIIAMYIGLARLYHIRIRKNILIYHKLLDLKFELIKLYKDQL